MQMGYKLHIAHVHYWHSAAKISRVAATNKTEQIYFYYSNKCHVHRNRVWPFRSLLFSSSSSLFFVHFVHHCIVCFFRLFVRSFIDEESERKKSIWIRYLLHWVEALALIFVFFGGLVSRVLASHMQALLALHFRLNDFISLFLSAATKNTQFAARVRQETEEKQNFK